ncbi:MAG TPA: GNAT family N-acetyltransferase [Acidobacteriaceae bacterium]|jgi:GNAT superfamily N-acetyltransferase
MDALHKPVYELVARNPTVEEYCTLRAGAGLSPRSEAIVRAALPNTLFAVVIEQNGKAVGMGRVVGDGGTVFQVADIAVLPEHQQRGLGKRILDAIDAWLRQNAPPGAFINLFADKGVASLYARYGFRPRDPDEPGMCYVME